MWKWTVWLAGVSLSFRARFSPPNLSLPTPIVLSVEPVLIIALLSGGKEEHISWRKIIVSSRKWYSHFLYDFWVHSVGKDSVIRPQKQPAKSTSKLNLCLKDRLLCWNLNTLGEKKSVFWVKAGYFHIASNWTWVSKTWNFLNKRSERWIASGGEWHSRNQVMRNALRGNGCVSATGRLSNSKTKNWK